MKRLHEHECRREQSKLTQRIFWVLILLVICLSSCSTARAGEPPDTPPIAGAVMTAPIGEPKINIEKVIKRKVTKEELDNYFEEYTFDTSVYLLEYSVSKGFWNRVSELSYEGIAEQIHDDRVDRYPTIYVPVFAEDVDANGNLYHRAIGYVRLYYHTSKRAYVGEVYDQETNFYERIVTYLKENEVVARQVFLLEEWWLHADRRSLSVAVVQTAEDTVILDYENSLHHGSWDGDNPKIEEYSISEYSVLKKKLEASDAKGIPVPVIVIPLLAIVGAALWVMEKLLYCLIIVLIGTAIFFAARAIFFVAKFAVKRYRTRRTK